MTVLTRPVFGICRIDRVGTVPPLPVRVVDDHISEFAIMARSTKLTATEHRGAGGAMIRCKAGGHRQHIGKGTGHKDLVVGPQESVGQDAGFIGKWHPIVCQDHFEHFMANVACNSFSWDPARCTNYR